MKKNLFDSRLRFVRWTVLLGILTGLFFSGGEGIRLLPFAGSDKNITENSNRVLTSNSNSFNFSTHHSRGFSLKINSEIQKNLKRILSGFTPDSVELKTVENFRFEPKKNHQTDFFSYDSFLLSSISGRAPPRI